MKAAIYARVSSAAQRDAHTIENQLRTLPAYVAAQGWELAGTYIDDGRSAKTGMLEAREGFARLLRDAEAKLFDLVVVVDVDRLTRTNSIEERAQILGPFQRLGIDIVTPSGGRLDMRTMLGELWITIQALGAAEENRKRAERIKAGKLRAIAEGRKPAGPTPFGYRYSRETGKWSVDEQEASIVREVYRRVAGGESCLEIADELAVRPGAPMVGRGTTWTRNAVYRIVSKRTYLGEWIADKNRSAAISIPTLITEAEWKSAITAMGRTRARGLRHTRHLYMLEGLMTCKSCGALISIRSACGEPGKKNMPAYVCRTRKLTGTCDAVIRKCEELDLEVWNAVCEELAQPELFEVIEREERRRASDTRDWKSDADGFRAHIARLERVEVEIMRRFRRGLISDGALDTELGALNRERQAVRDQLSNAERAAESTSSTAGRLMAVRTWLQRLRTSLPLATPEQRRALLVELVPSRAIHLDRGRALLDIRILAPAAEGSRGVVGQAASPIFLVNPSGYRTEHGTHREILRIRRVA